MQCPKCKSAMEKVTFQKVEVENGKIIPIKNDYYDIETTMLISSIGSLPEEIKGLHYEYSALKMKGNGDYHVFGFENVFAIGNAVTGRGNIQESKQHGKQMTERIIEKHLTDDALEIWLTNLNGQIKGKVNEQISSIVSEIAELEIKSEKIIQGILTLFFQKRGAVSILLEFMMLKPFLERPLLLAWKIMVYNY